MLSGAGPADGQVCVRVGPRLALDPAIRPDGCVAGTTLRRVAHVWELVTTWSFELPLLLGLLGAVGLYLTAARSVSRRHPAQPWSVRHSAFFVAGVTVVMVATLGPFGSLDDTFFWAHMTQHILLMMFAAPLLLLGEPVLLVLRSSTRAVRRDVVLPVLHSRVVRFLTHPVVSWVIFAGVLVGAHFTGFFEFALEHDAVHHYLEHPLYLGAGLLYFYPLLGTSPGASAMPPFAKVVSLFLMMLPETMVGFAIYMAGSVLYPHYSGVTDRPWGPSTAIADQRLGGAFMWSSAMVFDALWISVAVWEWLKAEEHKARRVDAAIARLEPSS
jgi:cytochrome c oxidase assembly factor CtaG